MKRLILTLLLAASLSAFAATKPTSVIHVITVKWKAGTSQQQIDAAVNGVEKMAKDYKGIKHIWLKKLKVQPATYSTVMVMEFASEASFKAYADSPAQKEWYKLYLPIREESTTSDATN